MAQSGHFATGFQCPLLEVKRTSARHFAVMHRAKRRVGNPSTFGFFGIPFFWRSRFFLALDGNETAFGGELIGRPLGWIGVSQLARQSDQPFALGMTIRTSSALFQGSAECAGSVRRVPATDIEALVVKSIRDHLKPAQPIDDRSLVHTHVARIEVQPGRLVIQLAEPSSTLEVPWHKTPARRRREILLPAGIRPEHVRPIRSETRARLVASIARGRRWLDELIADPTASADSIATRENCSARKINMTISLAFLAPDLVKAAIDGRLPYGLGVARLSDLPAEWSRQHQVLGLPGQ